AGLLYDQINADIISSSGVFSGSDMAKMILAGANAVQVVSALYKKGMSHLETILQELTSWMITKDYEKLDDFRGKLSKAKMTDPFAYKRAQYVDILMKSEIFMKYHPKGDEELY
ncbi:MAG: dihydroorotate dehydrogenase, partial [Bacteroidota bacterium]